MKRGKIIIVEGTSGVGKTTLCKNFERNGWINISEHTSDEGAEGTEYPTNEAEEKLFQEKLFEREYKKIKKANELADEGENVVIDKTFLAVIASAVAIQKKENYNSTAKNSVRLYKELLYKLQVEDLKECDAIIYMTADNEIVRKRCRERGTPLDDFWTADETLDIQNEYLQKILKTKEDVVIGNIDTTRLSSSEVFERIYKFIGKNILKREKDISD